MSLGGILNSARSGMVAQQAAVQTAAQNIANATTAGYSRQQLNLVDSTPEHSPYGPLGTGVTIAGVTRARDTLLDGSYRTRAAGSSSADVTSAGLSQVEGLFGEPSDSGLSAALDSFWSAWSDLSNDPTGSSARSVVREAGSNLAGLLNQFASQLDDLQNANKTALGNDVDQANNLSRQIGQLNDQIVSAEADGKQAPDLRDTRDRLVDQIAALTGGQSIERQNGSVAVYVGGRMIVDGVAARPLQLNPTVPPTVSYSGASSSLDGLGGKLGAELDLGATRLPAMMSKLDTLAKTIVQQVNSVHAAGKIYSGSPPVAAAAGNFFEVTASPPSGGDPLLTARGIRLASTLTSGAAIASSGGSSTGPGDNSVALALAGLRDTAITITPATGGPTTATIGDYYGSIVGGLATATKQATDNATIQKTLTASADAQRQSVSGVSTDEELVSVIQHQHAYQAAARLVNIVDSMMETLVGLGQH